MSLLDWPEAIGRRSTLTFAAVSVILAALVVFGLSRAPNYTDAYYYFNSASRLASGQGLTEPYLWTYLGAPDALRGDWVVPAHQYWMPLASLLAAAGMTVAGAPGSYEAGQLLYVPMAWALALIGFGVGAQLGRSSFSAWLAGLLTLLSPFYAGYWGRIESVTPYALAGSACLLLLGGLVNAAKPPPPAPLPQGERSEATKRAWLWWGVAGALAGFAHLSRADGLLFAAIAVLCVGISARRERTWRGLTCLLPVVIGYVLVMLPWWMRNYAALGTLLPTGGAEGAFFVDYDDLFLYPAGATLQRFVDLIGWQGFITTRLEALFGPQGGLSGNLATFLAVEGMIFLAPFMVVGMARRLREPFLWPFLLAAVAIHGVFTLIFPFAGYRGGLLHSAGALVPFWAALGVLGLRDCVEWVARRRRNWRVEPAMRVFGPSLIVLALLLLVSLNARRGQVATDGEVALFAEVDSALPPGARVFSVDPPQLYSLAGRGGAVIPKTDPANLPELAARFEIGYLLLREGMVLDLMLPVWDAPPSFLTEIPLTSPGVRLYEISASASARP